MRLSRQYNARRILAVVIPVLVALAFIAFRIVAHNQIPLDEVRLVRVSDGDTVVVEDSRGMQIKVRMIGVDAPELGTAASFRSALFAAEMCERAVSIKIEPETTRGMDKYGRTLGWVWLQMPDGRRLLLNEEMIGNGHAKLYRDTNKSVKYYDRLR